MKLQAPASEKVEERGCIELYEAVGCKVYKISQPRATMQTPGIPDLLVFLKTWSWWHEVKRCQCEGMRKVNTKQTVEQGWFETRAELAGHEYLLGCMCKAEEKLRELGVLV